LESLVLAVERRINGRDRNQTHPAWGEDVKVLAVRQNSKVDLTVACAMIGRRLSNLDDYIAEKHAVEELARAVAAEHSFRECNVTVNAADDLSAGAIYLTVTGTSAENGDDGEVGRGNRVNGLITPCRPMSLEAAAGKNPVTHVGKIYNVVAHRIANAIISAMPEIAGVECLMVSRIGAALTNPALLQIRLATHNGAPAMAFEKRARDIAFDNLNYIPRLLDDFIAGTVELF
jgi:S-adenosylmethionine synthetase